MEVECMGGGEEAVLQLHLLCDPSSSCTKAVGTEMSMADISDLHTEVCELRELVSALEETLQRQKSLNTCEEVNGATPALCSVCKADLHTAVVQDSAQSVCAEREVCEVECVPHTPLMTCSVKVVDCRTMELIASVRKEEKENDEDGEWKTNYEDKPPPCESDGETWSPSSRRPDVVRKQPHVNKLKPRTRKAVSHKSSVMERASEVNGEVKESLPEPDDRLSDQAVRDRAFKCLQCDKSYGKASSLRNHMKRHAKEMRFCCEECGKGFVTSAELKLHTSRHTGVSSFVCEVCGQNLAGSSGLKAHMLTHSDERPFSCRECGKTFRTKGNLKAHLRTHTGEKPYHCSYCERTFSHAPRVKVHERSHTKEKPFKCQTCEKTFSRLDSLRLHENVHTGLKPYQCSHCGKSFRQASHLLCHERTHTGERPYLCSDCGKRFSSHGIFRSHRRIHTGERPYHCTACGKSFRKQFTLHQHSKTHTGERPYKCTQCDKSFARTCTLKQHQRMHSGEKPYQCTICGEKFTFLSSLHQHRKKHGQDGMRDTGNTSPLAAGTASGSQQRTSMA
ncbi:gastrula zinc finger protein XlCGF57.1-like [Tachysurus ichikawai]